MCKGALVAGILSAAAFAQPRFDVAVIKPNRSMGPESSIHYFKGRIVMKQVSLRQCIETAYGFGEKYISGPSWLGSEMFDIEAHYPANTAQDQVPLMLQTLLQERFRLATHREEREVSGFVLHVGRDGAKLSPTAGSGPFGRSSGRDNVAGRGMTMAALAEILSQLVDRPVMDETGLQGGYDVSLNWVPDPPPGAGPAEVPAGGPTLFRAVEQQLGLTLRSRKVRIPFLVIDLAKRTPTPN